MTPFQVYKFHITLISMLQLLYSLSYISEVSFFNNIFQTKILFSF